METISEFKGLNGNILAFKEEVKDLEKVTFLGTPGVCTPFAALFSYAIRDKESHFISLTDINTSHQFEFKPFGMQLNEKVSNPHKSDAVVLLGGLAMPKSNVDIDELNALIKEILKEDGKIIGVCYMDMFTKAGWLDKVDFDSIVDGTLTGVTKK
ncbi:DUF2124 domain-containing protein [Methanobrevibacter olleyae]|uniref:DUF2124 domain-containing protein n=1 Tax=Methanobrevibacter olleyae TaxID=294671 RepID=A0A126QXV2_METOL|nr:DUF2124 domain-containing protein [Methanobrevibacter olleyae]AMK14861.1 hypothetical protein YLM1_0301 [Methanobrevibacter olleyae]SFL34387.1 hypothetical protein SAMN02910297_00624 [Methanobrevibacter olleyae]